MRLTDANKQEAGKPVTTKAIEIEFSWINRDDWRVSKTIQPLISDRSSFLFQSSDQ